jgi:DNA-binding response OmpR family regulator
MTDQFDIHGARILIVDDCRDTASTLCELLKWKGYTHAFWTTDGKAVPGLVAEEHFGLIFLDMHMPNPSGVEVIRNLHTTGSAYRVSVIAISGDQRYRTVSIAAGACAFLIKPFSQEEIEAAIFNVLSGSSSPLARHAKQV